MSKGDKIGYGFPFQQFISAEHRPRLLEPPAGLDRLGKHRFKELLRLYGSRLGRSWMVDADVRAKFQTLLNLTIQLEQSPAPRSADQRRLAALLKDLGLDGT